MKDDFSVDFDGWRRLVRSQIEGGVDGIVTMGTTGENPTLLEEEEDTMIAIAMEECKDKAMVMVGAGSNSTKHAVKYTERAQKAGADCALVVTPYYNKPNDSGLLAHFREVASVGLPVIVYNIAGRTGRNIQTPLMEKIAELPNICGVKEASGDIAQIGDVINNIKRRRAAEGGDPFWVLSGDDALTLSVMALGGDGVVSVISNLLPAKVAALVKACKDGNDAEAQRLHFELLPFIRAAFMETNPAPIKRMLTLAGLPGGPCRLPLGPVSEATEKALAEIVKKM
jgi:4-hydroxy-tetrahydrodipicolinate synthase